MRTRGAQLARLVACAALALAGAGCARVFGSYDFAPNGLTRGEDRLRNMLRSGHAVDALTQQKPPEDEVLRALYRGVIAYHAGDYAASAQVMDAAARLADDRYTKSLSRAALSVVSNDLVLPYEPSRTERLMIPFYGALARLRTGDAEGAAVEARRLSTLLQRYEEGKRDIDPALRATLRYIAAGVFAANGNVMDADVAYRNVLALDSLYGAGPLMVAGDTGVVLVILEQGFVAHRAEEGLSVMLLPEEVDAIAHGDGELRSTAVGLVTGRIVHHASNQQRDDYFRPGPYQRGTLFVPPPQHTTLPKRKVTKCTTVKSESVAADSTVTVETKQECKEVEEQSLPYLLKVAWPVYRSDYRPAGGAQVVCCDTRIPFASFADVSRSVIADFEAERALIVARTIARGTAKLALTKAAENKLEEKNEAAGKILGLLGNVGNALLERADTRSWHLLPAGISVARVVLPPGEHELSVVVNEGAAARTLALGSVAVRAGGITIIPVRAW